MATKSLARSPVHRRLADRGASFFEIAGWLSVDQFGDVQEEAQSARSAVGICDLSLRDKWEMQGANVARVLSAILGGNLQGPGRAIPCDGGYACWLSRDEVFLIFERENVAVISKLRQEVSTSCLHIMDRTSGFGLLLLCGPQTPSLLRKLTSLDVRESAFPDLHCAWTPMAGIRVLLVRKDRRDLCGYEILVSREYAEYLLDTLMDAGQRYAISMFGLKALRILEGG